MRGEIRIRVHGRRQGQPMSFFSKINCMRLVLSALLPVVVCAGACAQVQPSATPTTRDQKLKQAVQPRRSGVPGIYIPVKEARQVTFRRLFVEPVVLLDAKALGVPDAAEKPPILTTVGVVTIDGGLKLGTECREHLWPGMRIQHGAVQNTGPYALELVLSHGDPVRLEPQQAIYIGNDIQIVRWPNAGNLDASHSIECFCTCHCGAGVTEVQSFACGERCQEEGNQCTGINGMACSFTTPGGVQCEGTIRDCQEMIVPLPKPEP